jgi:hypothetical protein
MDPHRIETYRVLDEELSSEPPPSGAIASSRRRSPASVGELPVLELLVLVSVAI